VTDLQAPPRTEPSTLPAPTLGVAGEGALMPPPPFQVWAVTQPPLPVPNGAPIVPPMPRFVLSEAAEIAETADAGLDSAITDATVPAVNSATEQVADLGCPPILKIAPAIALSDTNPSASVAAPVMDPTVVDVISNASPSDQLGNPPPVAIAPLLPGVTATQPSSMTPQIPVSHRPMQHGATMTSLADARQESTAQPVTTGRGFGRSFARTIFGVVLAGALGAGAHLGYDWWEQRDAVGVGGVAVDGRDLASWPQVDPPEIRYTDSVTTFRRSTGVRTLTAHREIASGQTQAAVQSTDAVGTDLGTVEVDFRGEQSFIRPTPESPWALTSQEDALARIGDSWTEGVFTVTDVFPTAAVPYMTVLESVERVLPVRPLNPAAAPNVPADPLLAISAEPTSMVWQYRVIVDVESFRSNEALAHQEWTRRLGKNAVSRIEAWVDSTGIVRQLSVDLDGTLVTHTLVAGAATSTRFDGNPLLDTDPVAAVAVPAGEPASVEPGE